VLGVRVKSGWAAVVLMGGSRDRPTVLDARRLALADPDNPDTIQPYHAGTGTAQTDSRVVRRLIGVVERCAQANTALLIEEYRTAGRLPAAAVAIGTSNTDPETITNPHIRIHALEGRLFRRVVEEALTRCGVGCAYVLEQAVLGEAPAALGRTDAEVKRRLAAMRPPGGSWRSEQKVAALAGWMGLPQGG